MAKKLILVPMELYKGLVSTRDMKKEEIDLKERAPIYHEKAELKKVRRKRGKNVSAKNLLYQQQLRRYLRARKEGKDRPVRVQFEDMQLLAKPTTKQSKAVQTAMVTDEGDLEDVVLEEKKPAVRLADAEETGWTAAKTPESKPKVSTPKTAMSSTSTGNGNDTIYETPPPKVPTPRPTRSTRTAAEERKKINEEKSAKLLELIQRSPAKFGVTSSGGIINPTTKKPVQNSNLQWIVNRLVDPKFDPAGSPPGMKFLKKAVLNDVNARQFVDPTQLGYGKRTLLTKDPFFRPSIWRR